MRANSTETIYYLYDREDRIGDYDADGNLLISYTHGPGIDEPVAMTMDNSTYFYIPEIQGSIRAIVDENGNLMASYIYDVWGNLISYNGTLAEQNDYLYTGREYDWQAGIYYYRYRYYNPEIGRFMQSSWEHDKEMNMYVYVGNDPVNGVDPTGHPGYVPPYLQDREAGGFNICFNYCIWSHGSEHYILCCLHNRLWTRYSGEMISCCKEHNIEDCNKLLRPRMEAPYFGLSIALYLEHECMMNIGIWGSLVPGEGRPYLGFKPNKKPVPHILKATKWIKWEWVI